MVWKINPLTICYWISIMLITKSDKTKAQDRSWGLDAANNREHSHNICRTIVTDNRSLLIYVISLYSWHNPIHSNIATQD